MFPASREAASFSRSDSSPRGEVAKKEFIDPVRRAAQDSRDMGGDLLKESQAFYDECRWEEAGAALVALLAQQPANAAAWYRLGNVRGEQGRDHEAIDCFARAVALDPAHARAWNNLGTASQRLGRGEEALVAYRTALERDPELFEPYLNLG